MNNPESFPPQNQRAFNKYKRAAKALRGTFHTHPLTLASQRVFCWQNGRSNHERNSHTLRLQ